MGEYSLSEYHYSSPYSSWIEEIHHGWAKKSSVSESLASDLDFALSCFDHGTSALDDFDFLSTRDRRLRRAESSLFSAPFRAMDREPFAVTERIAAVKRTTPFATTIRKVRSTTAEGWDSFGERVEKTELFRSREDDLHELADRIAALEVGFNNLYDFKATKNQKTPKKEWKSQKGRKAEVSYSYYSAKRAADPFTATGPWIGEFSTCRAETCAISRPSEPQTRVIPVEDGEGNERAKKIQARQILAANNNVFARKRAAAAEVKGKRKELSPQDAALIIQARFQVRLYGEGSAQINDSRVRINVGCCRPPGV